MTMTRIEDSASASAKAVPAGQVTASARKGKVAKAGYRTLSPLKTVYKVRPYLRKNCIFAAISAGMAAFLLCISID